jgi:hypothetical protein
MNVRLNKGRSGIVLIVAMCLIVAVGIVLASYVTLMESESASVSRSQNWNQCVPVMEAGVEEAFAQIHFCNNTTNLSSNSWTLETNHYYQKTRTVGTDGSYCVIQISATTPPVIYSTAYVPLGAYNAGYITREVRVTTTNQSAGSGGLVAKGAITMTGNARLDSYNSAVAPYNPASPGTNAIALTDSTAAGAISLAGSSKIYGMAVTGPGGTITWGGTSSVGGTAWNAGGTGGVQSGWSANDANVQINDNPAPSGGTGWPAPLAGKVNGTNYTYVASSGNYYESSAFALTGIQTMAVSGPVTFYVAAGFSTANSAYIYIAPGSSLTVYSGGTVSISGAGIVNGPGSTSALTIYGLTNCTSISYLNSGVFVGSVNAPEAALTISGAGGAFGAFIGNTITIGNSGAVHYDQSLGASAGTIASSWNELQ